MFHARTKRIEVDYHFIHKINQNVNLHYIPSKDHIGDILTKGPTLNRFKFLKSKLIVCEPLFACKVELNKTTQRLKLSSGDQRVVIDLIDFSPTNT